jgi:hypothetical protein
MKCPLKAAANMLEFVPATILPAGCPEPPGRETDLKTTRLATLGKVAKTDDRRGVIWDCQLALTVVKFSTADVTVRDYV